MAKTLGAKGGDNVTKLPARAARGAGKSKPSANPKRMKPAIPNEKKTPAAAATAQPETQADRDRKLRENLQARLVGLRSNHNSIVAAEEALKAELRELTAKKKEIRAAVQQCGVPLSVFDEALGDAEATRVDLKAKEKARDLIREAYGLVTLTQPDLLDNLPEAAKPGVYWEAQGYQDGIAGKFCEIPAGCPPENEPDYRRGFDNAMEANAKGIKALDEFKATPPSQADDDEGAGDGSDDETPEAKRDADFAAISEGLEQAVEMEEAAKTDEGDAAPSDASAEGDDFEATDEELAAQTPRAALDSADPVEVFH